jgi:hypothetical protein
VPIEVLVPPAGATGPAVADPFTIRLLVLALAVAISVVVALVAAMLAKVAGAHPAAAALRGGAAFAGTLALGVAILTALDIL